MENPRPDSIGAKACKKGSIVAFTVNSIERRVKALERTESLRSKPRIHEVETTPPSGDATNDFIATHGGTENHAVFVVPVRLHGGIQVQQASAAINTSTPSPAVPFSLAIYKYSPGRTSREDPLSTSAPYQLRRVVRLGTGQTTGTSPTRLNLKLIKEVFLHPNRGEYFIAYQTTEYGKWLCPGYSFGAYASRRGRKTSFLGEYVGDFPDTLTVTPTTAAVPWVALRSSLGVRLYGDVSTYDV
jgi:hypothetical protein